MVNSHYGLSTLAADSAVSTQAAIVSWAILALGIIGTPIYLYRRRLPGQPWMLNAGISTIAFVLWAYTLSGSVFRAPMVQRFLGRPARADLHLRRRIFRTQTGVSVHADL